MGKNGLSAQKERDAIIKISNARPPSFGPSPKRRQKGSRGFPPNPPGPQALSVYRPIQVAALLPVFLKRKPAGHPGLQGGSPLARLCLLSSCEERRWPSGQTWKNGLSVCPRKKNAILLKRRSNARPRPFSSWRKDAKRRLGGTPLSTPDGRPIFSL